MEHHERGHLRTGQQRCNKCGDLLEPGRSHDCWFCGPVCEFCYIGCVERNEHAE